MTHSQGEAFADFVASELEQEHKRRVALDGRGSALVTVSGSFGALLLASAAVVTEIAEAPATMALIVASVVSLLLFTATGVIGVMANRMVRYDVAEDVTMERMLTIHWKVNEIDARNVVARINLVSLTSLREGNNRKASLLVLGMSVQLAAFIALSLGLVAQVLASA